MSRYLANYYSTEKIAAMLDQTEDNIMLYMGLNYNWFMVEYTTEKTLIIRDVATSTIQNVFAEDEVYLVD